MGEPAVAVVPMEQVGGGLALVIFLLRMLLSVIGSRYDVVHVVGQRDEVTRKCI
jgi:hypothetical protein